MAIGLFDYVAVLFFIATAITLIVFMKGKVKRPFFIALCTGLVIITIAGTFKATNKLIIGINGNDIAWMRLIFFPLQAVGFTCVLIAVYKLLSENFKTNNVKTLAFAPVPFYVFLAMDPSKIYKPISQIILFVSISLILACFAYMSYKLGYKKSIILYISSEAMMITMTVIGFNAQLNEWLRESFNTANQVLFFVATFYFCKTYSAHFLSVSK